MRTHTATVFWNQRDQMVVALVTDGSMLSDVYNTPIGSFEFTYKTMPGPDQIRAWALPRLKLLDIPFTETGKKGLRVRSYLKNAAPWRRD